MREVLENLKYSFYSKYGMGEIVYLKTDDDNRPRIITKVNFNVNGNIWYCLAYKESESWHYDIEISTEKNQFMCL